VLKALPDLELLEIKSRHVPPPAIASLDHWQKSPEAIFADISFVSAGPKA
jgi:hypothetical protein